MQRNINSQIEKVMHIAMEVIKIELVKKHAILFVAFSNEEDFVTSITPVKDVKEFFEYCNDKGINEGFIIIQYNEEENPDDISDKVKSIIKYSDYVELKIIDLFLLDNSNTYKSARELFN